MSGAALSVIFSLFLFLSFNHSLYSLNTCHQKALKKSWRWHPKKLSFPFSGKSHQGLIEVIKNDQCRCGRRCRRRRRCRCGRRCGRRRRRRRRRGLRRRRCHRRRRW